MTEEQKKEYEEDIKGCGNLDYPLVGCILTPLCKICKNYIQRCRANEHSLCRVLGDIPNDIIACKKYDCECFEHDKESRLNIFFDENLQPIYK